jgi:hypothetical protein
MTNYLPPLDKLLTLGKPPDRGGWFSYLDHGLGPEHIPELKRMLLDPELNEAEGDSSLIWAPLHAWRALGVLGAANAVDALLQAMKDEDERDGDWALEEIPDVLAMIGPSIIPELTTFLFDASNPRYPRSSVVRALAEIAQKYPESRATCVNVLIRKLEAGEKEDEEFNGALVAAFMDLNAIEAAPAMERAFQGGWVDEGYAGSWEHVQWEMGLREGPPERPHGHWNFADERGGPILVHTLPTPRSRAKARAKAKRKQARVARKRNRKRH